MYLYTCEIEFAPFGSEENRRSRSTEMVDSSDYEVPRPSPRSLDRRRSLSTDLRIRSVAKLTQLIWRPRKTHNICDSTTSPR